MKRRREDLASTIPWHSATFSHIIFTSLFMLSQATLDAWITDLLPDFQGICTDFNSGVNLIRLLETLTATSTPPKPES
jgi:hypothetical protein